jgi:branched-chain amino acid transport system ATP-binding protein
MATPHLEIKDLHAWYGESHVLHGVNVRVQEGEVVSLLGRNGAGRTTTLRSIVGLTGRRTGTIHIKGKDCLSLAPHQVARLGVGYCPEERGIFASLSAEENLILPPSLAPGGMAVSEIYDCQAVSSRCSLWRASFVPAPSYFCSTKSRKVWRR